MWLIISYYYLIMKNIIKFINFFKVTTVKETFIKLFTIIIIIPIVLKYIYFTVTSFETTLTVKNKYKKYNSPDNDYDDLLIVTDNKNNKYNVTNLFFKFDFNKEEDWNMLKPNMSYKVKGYGVEIKKFGLYRNIYEVN